MTVASVGGPVFVLPSFAGGGAERVLLTFLADLDQQAGTKTLVVFDNRGPLRANVPPGVELVDLGAPRLRNALPRLIGMLRRQRPSCVISTLGYVNIALLACRFLLPRDCRILIREANMPSLSLPNTPHPWLMTAAYRLLSHRADAIVCTSRAMAREFSRDFGCEPERLHLIPNPVDVERLRAGGVQASADSTGIRLLAAGRLTRQKGFDRMITLMSELPDRFSLTIIGEGDQQGNLERRIAELGLGGRVRLAGFQADPVTWFSQADAFVLPSRWEGMPNAALEALALGVPVIATPETGGLQELTEIEGRGLEIAAFGPAFRDACKAVRPRSGESPCLLPPRFHRQNAAAAFNACIGRLLRRLDLMTQSGNDRPD